MTEAYRGGNGKRRSEDVARSNGGLCGHNKLWFASASGGEQGGLVEQRVRDAGLEPATPRFEV